MLKISFKHTKIKNKNKIITKNTTILIGTVNRGQGKYLKKKETQVNLKQVQILECMKCKGIFFLQTYQSQNCVRRRFKFGAIQLHNFVHIFVQSLVLKKEKKGVCCPLG